MISDHDLEQYRYHGFVCKVTSNGIIGDVTLLIFTNKNVYFVLLVPHKISSPMTIKQIKWSFPISNLRSITLDVVSLGNVVMDTMLFSLVADHQRRSSRKTSRSDTIRELNSETFKKFAFLDWRRMQQFNSILQTVRFEITGEQMRSLHLHSVHTSPQEDDEMEVGDNFISGYLMKIRDLNIRKRTRKWVRFINVGNDTGYIEWSESREALAVKRSPVIGISTDPEFLNDAPDEVADGYFVMICEQRVIVFVAKSEQERKQWIKESGLNIWNIGDFHHYNYINTVAKEDNIAASEHKE